MAAIKLKIYKESVNYIITDNGSYKIENLEGEFQM